LGSNVLIFLRLHYYVNGKQKFFRKQPLLNRLPLPVHKIIVMNKFSIRILAILAVVLIAVSCKKYDSGKPITLPAIDRNIRFQLYTNQDFSGNASVIHFSIFIKKGITIIFDSAFAPMQIKNIPDAAHKLVIEKTVHDNSDLVAGFNYEIEDVGNSWYIDTSKAGNPFKVIDYNFQ
jgi:hypothetical protein